MSKGTIMTLAIPFVLAAAQAVLANEHAKQDIAPRERYLLLDQRLISSVDNAVLKLGTVKKHPANPVLKDELPWEAEGSHMYASVVFDPEERIYKCWYYSHWWSKNEKFKEMREEVKPGPQAVMEGTDRLALLYATSSDGIRWVKPKLKIYLYKGKPTNIVYMTSKGAGVCRDPHDPDPQRRYKMIFNDADKAQGNLHTAFSADGIHWSGRHDTKITTAGDTHSNVSWDPLSREYVAISRAFSHGLMGYDLDTTGVEWLPTKAGERGFVIGQRVACRSASKDFVKWSPPEIVFEYGHDVRQIYAMPIFHAHGVFLGLPMIYDTKQFYNTARQDLGFERQDITPELRSELHGAGGSQRIWPGLTWSPDTKEWHWVGQRGKALIPLSEDPESVEWGMIFAASSPVVLDDEIRLYYSAQKRKHGGWNPGWLGLAVLRVDGWARYEPKDDSKDALIETQPIRCSGETLSLAADADKGSVVVTAKDANGNTLAESEPVTGSKPYAPVTWKNGFKLSAHKGQLVQLKFTINHAKLYSFMFDE